MKLTVAIPVYNERHTIASVLLAVTARPQGIAAATTAQVFLLAPVTLVGILILILHSTPLSSGWSWMRIHGRPSIGTSTLTAQWTPNDDR